MTTLRCHNIIRLIDNSRQFAIELSNRASTVLRLHNNSVYTVIETCYIDTTQRYMVKVIVLDALTMQPIENASVDFGGEVKLTDAAGVAKYSVTENIYALSVSAIGYEVFFETVNVTKNINKLIELELASYTVTFYVYNGEFPVEGATININSQVLTTNSEGVAMIDLQDGSYPYTVNKTGFTEFTGTAIVNNSDLTVNVALELATTDITFKVYDDLGAVKEGALVTVGDSSQFTDANGETVFSLMVGDSFNYSVSATNFLTSTGTFVASVGLTVTVNLLWNFDAETTDWESRVIANSGTISYTTKKNVDEFVVTEKAAGRRANYVRINLFLGDQIAACLTPLWTSKTPFGVVGNAYDLNLGTTPLSVYSENTGLQGNGSGYLNTGVIPNNTTEMGLSSSGAMVITRSNHNVNFRGLLTSYSTVPSSRYGIEQLATNDVRFSSFRAANSILSITNTANSLYFGYSLPNNYYLFVNSGNKVTSPTASAITKSTAEIIVFGRSENAVKSQFSSALLAGYAVTDSIPSDAVAIAMQNSVNAIQTKYGRNTY